MKNNPNTIGYNNFLYVNKNNGSNMTHNVNATNANDASTQNMKNNPNMIGYNLDSTNIESRQKAVEPHENLNTRDVCINNNAVSRKNKTNGRE